MARLSFRVFRSTLSSVLWVASAAGLGFLAAPVAVHAQNAAPSAHKTVGKSQFTGDLPNFAVVGPGIYRGAAPTPAGLQKLKAMGVRTIIDLRIENKGQDEEAATAKSLGLNRVRIRMGREASTKKQTAQFMSLVSAASPQNPVFIHCHYGADRTGAMVGIWRRTHDKWPFDKTYQEMRHYGFKSYLTELKGAVADCAK